jgi:hypothetical protein
MRLRETPMTREYWQEIGGTLIEKATVVPRGENRVAASSTP